MTIGLLTILVLFSLLELWWVRKTFSGIDMDSPGLSLWFGMTVINILALILAVAKGLELLMNLSFWKITL